MSNEKVATTAFLIAGIRALEESQEEPLFSDPYAKIFINDERRAYIQGALETHRAVMVAIRLRTILFNQVLEEELNRNVKQVVKLGCGFDMRHALYPKEGVRFFDVDQDIIINLKTETLKKAQAPICQSVACNYLEGDLTERLIQAGLDPEQETLFLWEGNTMYLPKDLMFEFLKNLSGKVPRCRIAFDYILQSVLEGTYPDKEAVNLIKELQQRISVQYISGFDTLDVFEKELPFKVLRSLNILDTTYVPKGSNTKQKLKLSDPFSQTLMDIYRVALIERAS